MKFHNSNDAYQYIIENTKLPEKLQYNKILLILQVCISEHPYSYQLKNTISQLATASESIEEAVVKVLHNEAYFVKNSVLQVIPNYDLTKLIQTLVLSDIDLIGNDNYLFHSVLT